MIRQVAITIIWLERITTPFPSCQSMFDNPHQPPNKFRPHMVPLGLLILIHLCTFKSQGLHMKTYTNITHSGNPPCFLWFCFMPEEWRLSEFRDACCVWLTIVDTFKPSPNMLISTWLPEQLYTHNNSILWNKIIVSSFLEKKGVW